jgi:hypothetical protein
MPNPFIGRRESIGVGIETAPGTAVAPQSFQRHLALTLDQKTTVAQNKSAMGRIEDINDSAVTEEWSEGSVNGKVTDLTFGYFLLNMFGTDTATIHATETTVYDNLFTVLQTSPPPSLTFCRVNPIQTRRYALGYQSSLEIDIKQNDWVQFTSTIVAKNGTNATDTAAYVAEREFTSKHVTTKIATNIAGLTAATPLQIKSLKLKLDRKQDRFTPVGAIDPVSFDSEAFTVTGSFVLRYTDTTLEALGLANTAQAMSIAIVNTDTTIGTAANPGVTFTLPQVRLAPVTLDNTLDQVLSQTINFTAEINLTAGYMIQALLTNTQNGYIHA